MSAERQALTALAERFIALPREKRREFLARLRQRALDPRLLPVPPGVGRGQGTLSYAQQRLWFLAELEPDSAAYGITAVLRLTGRLDADALAASVNVLIARHESLRTRFTKRDGVAHAEVGGVESVGLRRVDLAHDAVRDSDAELRAEVERCASEPFDLARDLPLRATLLREGPDAHVFVLVVHHIAADGWSMNLAMREMVELYAAFAGGSTPPALARPLAYADYAHFQRALLEAGELVHELEYWRKRLAGELPPLSLPSDRPRPALQSYRGARLDFPLAPSLVTALRRLASESGASLFMVLLASFATLLARYSGQPALRIGVPVANRDRSELEGVIGLFVNTLVLPFELELSARFSEVLEQTRDTVLEAQAHAQVPFEQLVDALEPVRSLSYSPLFQVLYNHQQRATAALARVEGLQIETLRWGAPSAQFDLALDTEEDESGQIHAVWSYATDLFDETRIQRMARHWVTLLERVSGAPQQRLGEIDFLQATEQSSLALWSRARAPLPDLGERSPLGPVLAPIHDQVVRNPEAEALVLGAERIRYGELWRRVEELAASLRANGVVREGRVGLCVPRSLDMFVAMLGILRAGGAFVPLDPEYPLERLKVLASDAELRVVVVAAVLRARIQPAFPGLRLLDPAARREGSVAAFEAAISEEQQAYVIYTSGSTGRPKGVVVSHGAIARHARAIGAVYGFAPHETVLEFASIHFDGSLDQWLAPLMHGARVVVRGAELWSPEEALAVMASEGVTVADLLPAYLLELARFLDQRGRCLPLRVAAVGGEALPREGLELLQRVAGDASIINGYGPTEAVVTPLTWTAERGQVPATPYAPIGAPVGDRSVFIVDGELGLQPIGVIGELCVGGPTLARGYLGQPGLTADRFRPDPWGPPGGRLYRTGDLARFRDDGSIEFLGRSDRQIKLRGYRIERGELEALLMAEPLVQEAAVVVSERQGPKRLVAYVGAPDGLDVATLKTNLAARVPEFMVPAEFVRLDKLPRTPTGKLDERALPEPTWLPRERREPRTRAERELLEIWQAVLGTSAVSCDDNFFELGGDSIISIQVVSRARARGLAIQPRDVFLHQTIAALAAAAEERESAAEPLRGPAEGVVPLSPIQREFFEQSVPRRHHYNQAVLLRPRARLGPDALVRALEHVVREHDAFRLRFRQTGQGLEQRYAPFEAALSSLAFSHERAADATAVEAIAERSQRELGLEGGPLFRAVRIEVGDGSERLLLIVHHLIVDGVSWRVLLADLEQAYAACAAGQEPPAQPRTDSFRAWSEELVARADSREFLAECELWCAELAGACAELPRDMPNVRALSADSTKVAMSLSREQTDELLRGVGANYRASIDELLLTALGRAVCSWAGAEHALLEVEGHGRSTTFGLDLGRTLGWFTSLHPLRLDAQAGIDESIRETKQRLRRIPQRGLGFSLLKHLAQEPWRSRVRALPRPRITFNYLGQFDGALGGAEGRFELAAESAGARVDPSSELDNWLVLNGQVHRGVLEFACEFARTMFHEASVQRLVAAFQRELEAIIVRRPSARAFVASDFPLAGLTEVGLETLALDPNEVEDVYPLTPLQQGMLFHERLSPERGTYVNQLEVELEGLDVERFAAAFRRALERHPTLRTSFSFRDGSDQPLQIVHRRGELRLALHDLRGVDTPRAAIADLRHHEREAGFDLGAPSQSKLVLARTDARQFLLIWTLHHVILDGWSSARLLSEVLEDYAGRPAALEAGSYRDYIAWLGRQDLALSRAYWREQLAALDGPSLLGAALPAAGRSHGYGELRWCLSGARLAAMRDTTERLRITLSTLIQGALSLLISRYTGKVTVALGLTVAGRPVELPRVEATLGLFINTLPVVTTLEPALSVAEYLQRSQVRTLELRSYEWTPLYELQAWANQPGQSLFDTLLVVENYPVDRALSAADFGVRFGKPKVTEDTNYPLTVSVHAGEAELTIGLRYDRSVVSDAVASSLENELDAILNAMVSWPERALGDLGLSARRAVPAAAVALASDPVLAAVARHAGHEPHAPALVCGAERLSYSELWSKVCALAEELARRGVRREERVGVLLERSTSSVVAMLGVMLAGAAFVPLDVAYPAERLEHMLGDAGISRVVSSRSLRSRFESIVAARACVELEDLGVASGAVPLPEVLEQQVAYVIYTSGSTGRPKGVVVTHGALARHCAAIGAAYALGPSETMLQFASLNFDGALDQWLAPLVRGARVVLRGPELWGPEQLFRELERERVTVADFLPSYLAEVARWAEEQGKELPLRVCAVGGEALSRGLFERLQRVRGCASIINGYGPTEAVVTPLTWTATGAALATPYAPIGAAIGDRAAHVLDRDLNPLPENVIGELYLGGPTLARGYHGRAGLTAERFVPDPFAAEPGARLYRTGDFARLLPDGQIEYVGRGDEQVKLRGYRVELGEIEAELVAEPEVAEAVVVVKESPRRLVGYLVPKELTLGAGLGAELRRRLARRLPDYLLPAELVLLERLPRTPVGKVDKRALPELERKQQPLAAAETELEQRLAAIWMEVLGIDEVGIDQNFFELGGHSILAMRVAGRVRSLLDLELPLATLFSAPTIRELGQLLAGEAARREASTRLSDELASALDELGALSDDDMARLLATASDSEPS